MKSLLATLLMLSFSIAQETPFTPYKDGYATPSAYNGTSRTLKVHDPDSKAWITHPVGDGAEKGVINARLQIYVGSVTHPGKLRVSLCSPLSQLEVQTRYNDFQAKDSVGEVSLSYDSLQRMVTIPLSAVFVKALSTYNGVVLEGFDDLEAEIGSLEGGHGALLYLTYGDKPDSALVQNVTANLIANHLSEIKGKDGTNGIGSKGADGKDGKDGAPGAPGAQGPQGIQGLQGIQGTAGDNSRAFALMQERGVRAQYFFDVFPGRNSTPDSSTWGNHLSRSSEGVNLVELNPGDSIAQFLGNGYFKAADSQSLNPFREISLEAKVFLSIDSPPDSQTIVAKAGQYEMAIIGNQLKARFKTVLGGWEWLGAGAVPTNAWHGVKVAYDGRAVRTWVDGAQTYYRNYPNGPLASGTDPLYVGARAPAIAGMKGSLNLVSISGFVAGVQDSVGNFAGKVTRAQVVADSVAGLQALLDAKANLSGASFTGPVGIGKSPTVALDIFTKNGGMQISSDTGSLTLGQWDGTTNRIEGDAKRDLLVTSYSNLLRLGMLGNTSLAINQTGNVGIGTTTPQTKLDIAGGIKVGVNGTKIGQIQMGTYPSSGCLGSGAAGDTATVNFTSSFNTVPMIFLTTMDSSPTSGATSARVTSSSTTQFKYSAFIGNTPTRVDCVQWIAVSQGP